MSRCKGKTKNGNQCRNNAISGTNYCYLKAHCKSKATIIQRLLNFIRNNLINLAALVLGILAIIFYFQDKNLDRSSGVIASNDKAKARIISVGSTRFIIEDPDNVFLTDNGEPIIKLKIEKSKLFVSTVLRNSNGELIAELVDNEWKINKNSIFDRNYTDVALEVKDATGEIVLQVVNFGKVIHIAGKFYCRSGKGFALIPAKEGGAYLYQSKPGDLIKGKIIPIFNFPSELHLGECPGFLDLKKIVDSGVKGYLLGGSLELCK